MDCVWDKSAVYFYLRSSLTAADLVFFKTFATCDWLSCGCRVVGGGGGTPYWVIERSSPSLGAEPPFRRWGAEPPNVVLRRWGAEPPNVVLRRWGRNPPLNSSTYLQAHPKTTKERSFYTDRFYMNRRGIELSDVDTRFGWLY